ILWYFHTWMHRTAFKMQYFLHSLPLSYTDAKTLEIRERARKLDLDPLKANLSHTGSSAATCSNQEIFLLIVVCSSPENRTRRNVIRQTWGNVTGSRGYSVLTLFAVGKAASASTQLEINEEAQEHRDIIEGSFIDSPEMQTQKMLMSVEWTVTFCPHARYILHTAQDVFVGVPSLAGYLLSLTQREDIYLGRVVHHGVPDRDPQSPGFVPIHQYPEEFYPDFCHGSAFLMSQDVARKVYVAAREVPLAVPPAAFVGICAKRAGIAARHSSRFSGEKHIKSGFSFISCVILLTYSTKDALPKFALFPSTANEFSLLQRVTDACMKVKRSIPRDFVHIQGFSDF
uniref:Hexosyltransferase n=1 Tax=Corvus moneduloides TaxID=1196302 RepID=A0A8U7NXX5_CORMO